MTAATLGYGTLLKVGDGNSPEVFTTIGEVGDFEDSDSVELVEATNHSSTGNRREYIAGLIDGDEISFPVNYIPSHATHNRATGLRGMIRTQRNFRLEEAGATEGIEFPAIIMSVTRSFPVADKMVMTVTLKKTSEPYYYTIS